jgi:hypothetical protein|tara:strand:+ start:4768 stop:5223 length:456 start_codon:yes stop_codon:yes gene_type:complete
LKKRNDGDIPLATNNQLGMTETLVFIIVDYLLDNEGYGYSTQISEYVVNKYPRRYTSREVVGILRNRPMFCHAQTKERRAGKKWRLDLLGWERYIQNSKNKSLSDKASDWGLEEKVQKLKMSQISKTLNALEELEPETLDDVYSVISQVWA